MPSTERIHRVLRSLWPTWDDIPSSRTYRQHYAADYARWGPKVKLTADQQGSVPLEAVDYQLLVYSARTIVSVDQFYNKELSSNCHSYVTLS